jgi:hypothetical protein
MPTEPPTQPESVAERRLRIVSSITEKIKKAPRVDHNGVPIKPTDPGGVSARAA